MPLPPRLLRPSQAGGFDPRRITGLALWLDAADTSYNASTGTWTEYDAARHGSEALALLREIDHRCRSLIKYSDKASEDARRLADEIRKMIGESKVDLL